MPFPFLSPLRRYHHLLGKRSNGININIGDRSSSVVVIVIIAEVVTVALVVAAAVVVVVVVIVVVVEVMGVVELVQY